MTLKETIEAVETFHNAFGIENNHAPTAALTEAEILLRYKLMREENEEYLEAAQKGDIVEIADALGDQLYILCGTILKHGLQYKIAEVFQEIQRSNTVPSAWMPAKPNCSPGSSPTRASWFSSRS